MNGLTYGRYVGSRAAFSRRKARILSRLGDQLIAAIRAQKPSAPGMPDPPTIYDHMDVRHWPLRTRRAFIAYLDGRYRHSVDLVVAEITAHQIYAASLKRRPLTAFNEAGIVLVGEGDGPHAETLPKVLHQEQ